MKIDPSEIDHIEEAGEMDGSPVKLFRTVGGFWVAVGRPMGRGVDQALSAGSHPAIVRYNVEKQYPNFRPSMMKSILFSEEPIVAKHSRFLSEELRGHGYDIYSIRKGNVIDFQITKHNVAVTSVQSMLKGETLEIIQPNCSFQFIPGISGAAAEIALTLGAKVTFK